jgi:ferritin-like metal-binding protein YciE
MATKTKPAKKALTKKAPTKKAPTKKAPTKKASSKKAPTKKAPTKKAPTKKAPTKKAATKKSVQGAKAKPDAAKGLRDLFENELKDIYWAEKALTKAIPKMIKNASSKELVDALNDHLQVTEEQVTRLEEVFESIGMKAQAKKCEAMAGLIKEAEELMEETEKGDVRDAGIILAGQKVEHYEIATYGTLCAFARILGEDKAASLLYDTLEEEKEADVKLTEIAETSINVEAMAD